MYRLAVKAGAWDAGKHPRAAGGRFGATGGADQPVQVRTAPKLKPGQKRPTLTIGGKKYTRSDAELQAQWQLKRRQAAVKAGFTDVDVTKVNAGDEVLYYSQASGQMIEVRGPVADRKGSRLWFRAGTSYALPDGSGGKFTVAAWVSFPSGSSVMARQKQSSASGGGSAKAA